MTVKELREKLAALPDSAIVMVAINDGYGLDYCAQPRIIEAWERNKADLKLRPADRQRQIVILEPEEEE